ncbi:MAG: hypothetical protein JOZ40_20645, partial [Methylobacteriaceae bacterium]|nr:hypothetical protein [Methylobacteriaceae bacterium]
MGYGASYFEAHVAKWIESGWLPQAGKLIEYGGQEFHGDQAEPRRRTVEFLRTQGKSEEEITAAIGNSGAVAISQVYRLLGIEHHSIDVDEAFGARYFDMNTFATPPEWQGQFDMVNNEGTIEHLINPINGFLVTHELLKVGGVARHSMPLTGWRDHGLMYPTIKFYANLLGENRYELLQADIPICRTELDFADPRFNVVDEHAHTIKDSSEWSITDAWLHLVYRKTSAEPFRIPSDHLQLSPDAERLAERLGANFRAFASGRLRQDAPSPANAASGEGGSNGNMNEAPSVAAADAHRCALFEALERSVAAAASRLTDALSEQGQFAKEERRVLFDVIDRNVAQTVSQLREAVVEQGELAKEDRRVLFDVIDRNVAETVSQLREAVAEQGELAKEERRVLFDVIDRNVAGVVSQLREAVAEQGELAKKERRVLFGVIDRNVAETV